MVFESIIFLVLKLTKITNGDLTGSVGLRTPFETELNEYQMNNFYL